MISPAKTVNEYLESVPAERKAAMKELRSAITRNLPPGFKETMGYGMMGYAVPLSFYPKGYHCTPGEPLPFLGIASQKNFIALYHMGLYSDPDLLAWFKEEFPKHSKAKLDMGKSCVRFKKPEHIPYELIGELAAKMSPADWVMLYEKKLRK